MKDTVRISVILTGATGMAGEGVLHECIKSPFVDRVLIIGRRPSGYASQKVSELLVKDLADLSAIQGQLSGYDACYFCMGVSSVGMKEAEYTKLTYDLTTRFAGFMKEANPGIVFCYISGSGTDSTEKGRSMWARVKGRTENTLLAMFPNGYMFRPGYLHPTPGLKNTLKYYKYVMWLYPLFRLLMPSFIGTLADLGRAMISVTIHGYHKKTIEVKDIKQLSLKLLT